MIDQKLGNKTLLVKYHFDHMVSKYILSVLNFGERIKKISGKQKLL
jgi:hypothetical protein